MPLQQARDAGFLMPHCLLYLTSLSLFISPRAGVWRLADTTLSGCLALTAGGRRALCRDPTGAVLGVKHTEFYLLVLTSLQGCSCVPAPSDELLRLRLPMPVSPSGVSGISARHFRNCRSFDEL